MENERKVMMESTSSLVHIRIDGRSLDIPMDDIDIGFASSDTEIKQAVAEFVQVPVSKLQNFAIERNELEDSITLRPNAVFGA